MMRDPIENKVFIHFIGMNEDIRFAHNAAQLFYIFRPQDGAGWIMRGIEQDHPRPTRYPASHSRSDNRGSEGRSAPAPPR